MKPTAISGAPDGLGSSSLGSSKQIFFGVVGLALLIHFLKKAE